ncbi:MAG: type II toxin-antitoxin system Phd/YefM family antitoxin [Chloroflexi bacterium]|nr:type II toxin-antitoxin system Phd/YefM family antitoxin [Chloroflexota bacterium]
MHWENNIQSIGVRELQKNASGIVRQVRENSEKFLITHRGRAIANLLPVDSTGGIIKQDSVVWEQMNDLTEEISALWPEGVTTEEAVREQRRDL